MLPNGLRLHLAHDPAASRAAAWLRVAAGSHDEPSAHPGLAHFLEHLSFLGGAAFPGDERLMPWLQVRGGQVNASTRGRTTDYFFEVTAEHLGAGLARLIDMLARPLLDIDAQRREREVLEAEYLARSADEQTLIDAALALGLPAGHPLRRFAAGRRDSLALENDAFQRALREFHAAHYHAGNCQLWLQGPQALDELERLAQRACADLPGRAPGASPPPPPLLPFAGEALALRLPGPPRLVLGFALDALREADEQTLQAFAELLGDRSPGGLLAALGEQGLGESAALRVVHRDARQALLALTFELFDGSATAALEAAFFDWLGALRDDAASLLAARRPLLAEPTAPLERLRQRVLGLPAEIRPACLDALRADRCLRLHLDSELDGAEARWSAGFRLSVAPVAAAPPLAAQRHAWRFELPLPPSAAAEGALFLRWRFPGVPARSRFLALRQALRPLCGQARLGGVEMGLEALGEDWSLCLLGPRDRLEAAVRPALARLLAAPSDWRASGERLSSAERRRSATGLPIRQLLDALPGLLGEPLAEVDDWRRTRWDALVMRPRCQIPDGCPARLPASAWSLCRRGPDGIAANWPWTASRRCCCSVRCPRRRCRWRRPGACWRACTNRPSSGACATSCNWATRCSAASARSAPGAACCSPRNLRVPARNACWSIWRPSSSAPPRRSRNCRRNAWPACAKPSPTTCAERRAASPSEHGAPGRSTLAVAPVAPGCSPRPLSA